MRSAGVRQMARHVHPRELDLTSAGRDLFDASAVADRINGIPGFRTSAGESHFLTHFPLPHYRQDHVSRITFSITSPRSKTDIIFILLFHLPLSSLDTTAEKKKFKLFAPSLSILFLSCLGHISPTPHIHTCCLVAFSLKAAIRRCCQEIDSHTLCSPFQSSGCPSSRSLPALLLLYPFRLLAPATFSISCRLEVLYNIAARTTILRKRLLILSSS